MRQNLNKLKDTFSKENEILKSICIFLIINAVAMSFTTFVLEPFRKSQEQGIVKIIFISIIQAIFILLITFSTIILVVKVFEVLINKLLEKFEN